MKMQCSRGSTRWESELKRRFRENREFRPGAPADVHRSRVVAEGEAAEMVNAAVGPEREIESHGLGASARVDEDERCFPTHRLARAPIANRVDIGGGVQARGLQKLTRNGLPFG